MRVVLGGLRRLKRATIWSSASVSAEDARLAGLLRYGLPALDFGLVLFGVFGFVGGIPALRDTFSQGYAEVWALTVAIAAFVCLVGIAFPAHLRRVEFIGKAALLGLLSVYSLAVFIAGGTQADVGRQAVGWAILGLCVLPAWRLVDLGRIVKREGWR